MPQAKKRVSIRCELCGIVFEKLPCQIKKTHDGVNRGKYCSKDCRDNARKNGSELFCALCDTKFYRRYGEQDRHIRKNQFCSRECYMNWRIIKSKASTYLKNGPVHIHRIVAEAILNRRLENGEVVHHIDNNKQNNNPSNLAVFTSQADHARCHAGNMSTEELKKYLLQH